MKIAILGTRGIPNNYGGFEQFAEYLSVGLVAYGHEVYVYTSHDHQYQEKTWNGVHLIHVRNPEKKAGTFGQFIYDFYCIADSRKRKFDIIYQLGYTSSSVWGRLLPRKATIITNMDGLEWKRTKYSAKVQRFLLYAEKLAVKTSDHLIADSLGIKHYLEKKYHILSTYIPYGTYLFDNPDPAQLQRYNMSPFGYSMLIARLEPENSIDVILEGVSKSSNNDPFLVIGNHNNKYGEFLKSRYKEFTKIRFVGSEYDIDFLNNLRYFATLYFHGHTVGGTNPSLLEAMGSHALICAHANEFNSSILGEDAFYFQSAADVTSVIDSKISADTRSGYVRSNIEKVQKMYLWPQIVEEYEKFFSSLRR